MIDASIAGIAVIMDTPVYMDRKGKEVSEIGLFGLEQNIKITTPEYLLCADESGCNTSQKKDRDVGGTKFSVQSDAVPQVMSSTMDHKFTLFPFTSTSVEAICCVVICFKAKQVRFNCGGGQGLIILLIPSAKQTVKLHTRRTLEKESTIQVGQCTSTMERWLTILYLPMRAVKFRQYSCRNFGAFLWN